MSRLAVAVLTLLLAGGRAAALTQAELDTVSASPEQGAQIPADLALLDGDRPAVLVFADFECTDICNPLVAATADALSDSGLSPATDYQLVIAGIDPEDGPDAAARFLDATVTEPDMRRRVVVPDLDPGQTARLEAAMGYTAVYDPERGAYAHPAGLYVLDATGTVARVFPGLLPEASDLRRALVSAGNGAVGGILERIVLTCYGFNAATGRYTLAIERVLMVSSFATMAALALGIGLALRRERRGQRS